MKRSTYYYILLLILNIPGVTHIMANPADDKVNLYEFIVNAPVKDVYRTWTTGEGLESFFAPECHINLNLFGDLHCYFFPQNKPGQRGAEDEKIISFEENKMLSFTWGFPTSLMNLRNTQKTIVLLRFEDLGNGQTKVQFTQSGWGSSEEWQLGREYFLEAFGNVVLARFRYRFAHGPVDWQNLPDYSAFRLYN